MGSLLYHLQKAGYSAEACASPVGGVRCAYPLPSGCQREASITIYSPTVGFRDFCGAHSRSILTHGLGTVEAAIEVRERPVRLRQTLARLQVRYQRLSKPET